MKITVYLRVASTERGPKVSAAAKPNYKPLEVGSGWNARVLPTAAFAVKLEIPDEIMRHAERVLAEIEVPPDKVTVAHEVGE